MVETLTAVNDRRAVRFTSSRVFTEPERRNRQSRRCDVVTRVGSRSLIAIGEVEGVFNDEIVKEFAQTLKPPADPDIARFAQSIRISARIFLEAKGRLSAPQFRAVIERLYHLNTRAEDGNDRTARALARAVDAMPADVRQWLLSCNTPRPRFRASIEPLYQFDTRAKGGSDGAARALTRAVDAMPTEVRQWLLSCNTPHDLNVPTATEILSPATRQGAVARFRLILSWGGRVVPGRKRPGGRRSRSFIKPLLRLPERIERGRPRGEAERDFVQGLALAYVELTGRSPPRTANYNIDIRGPFSDFVHRCFELVGAPTGNVTRLLNQYGAARRRGARRRRTSE
jgi:hypothetical protein